MTKYVRFQSNNELVLSHDCTTRWSDSVGCNIPMSGIYNGQYTNLMIMTGDESIIDAWLADNAGKVVEITEEEGNLIGQAIVPEGTIVTSLFDGGEISLVAGVFTMSGGQSWTPVE